MSKKNVELLKWYFKILGTVLITEIVGEIVSYYQFGSFFLTILDIFFIVVLIPLVIIVGIYIINKIKR